MAYSLTKYQLTNLIQEAWFRLGQMKRWKVTGGSTTTVINTAWAGVEEPVFEDDDPSLIYGTVVVIEDAGGLGAAPEGEMGGITDYDSASSTITMDALSSVVAANDIVGIVSPLFPIQDMMELANIAIQKLGEIDIPDASLVVVAGQTEYTLPSTIRQKPIRVSVQTLQESTNNQWRAVVGWKVMPATAGSNWTLIVPNLNQGYDIQVLYRGLHPRMTTFDANISDSIHPELALCALVSEAYQWYNNTVGGSNPYFLQRENKSLQDLEAAKVTFPIQTEVEQVQGMVHWGTRGEYIPLTSDLRG